MAGNHRHCCVPFCESDGRYVVKQIKMSSHEEPIYFHCFPKDPIQRKKWIIASKLDQGKHFQITAATVVCSKHFFKDDYKWSAVWKTLKPGTVPDVFDWTINTPKRKSPRKRICETREEMNIDECESTSKLAETKESDTDSCPESALQLKLKQLETKVKERDDEIKTLKKQLHLEKFGLNRFTDDDEKINLYTGFPTYQSFISFYNFVKPASQNMQSAYYKSSESISLKGRPRAMLLVDELFLFLSRLRLNLLEEDLSVRFNISKPTISRKIITWANFLYFVLGQIPIWLEKDIIERLMPQCFKDEYPTTRVIIDCTEIYTQTPSSMVINSQLYSHYKSTTTFKALIGIAPHGAITFISQLYTGCMSDVEITRTSGLLDLLEPGDSIMADKGFVLKKDLEKLGVGLNIPPFLVQNRQFSQNEIEETETIARLRIHVERIMKRIKENRIFSSNIPMSLVGSINQIWTVAALLANFNKPIVTGWGV